MNLCSICCKIISRNRLKSVECYCDLYLPVCDICESSLRFRIGDDRKEHLRKYCLHKAVDLI